MANLELKVISLQDLVNNQESKVQQVNSYMNSRNMLRQELQTSTHKIIELEEVLAKV